MYILIKKWEHLDPFSRCMIIIYQIDLSTKLAFFIIEYNDHSHQHSDDPEDIHVAEFKSAMRTLLYLINSLFIMALHMFVLKL